MLFFKKIFKEKDLGLDRVIDCIKNNLNFEPLSELELNHLKDDLTNFERNNLLYTAISYNNVNAVKILINDYNYNLSHIYASRLYSDYPGKVYYHTDNKIVSDLEFSLAPLFFFENSLNIKNDEQLIKQYQVLEFLCFDTPFLSEKDNSYIKSEILVHLFQEVVLGTNASGDLSYNLIKKLLKNGLIVVNPEKENPYGENNILSLVPNWNQKKTLRLIDLLFEYGANPYCRIKNNPSFYESLLSSNIKNNDPNTQKIILDIEKRMSNTALPEDCHYYQLINLICSNDKVENFKNNINSKHNIYIKNKDQQSILFTLLFNTNNISNSLIMHMLNCKYNLLEQDSYGNTPLHILFTKRPILIPFLLLSQKNLNFDILNNKGQSPKTLLNDPNGLYSPLIAEYEKNIISVSIQKLDVTSLKQRL